MCERSDGLPCAPTALKTLAISATVLFSLLLNQADGKATPAAVYDPTAAETFVSVLCSKLVDDKSGCADTTGVAYYRSVLLAGGTPYDVFLSVAGRSPRVSNRFTQGAGLPRSLCGTSRNGIECQPRLVNGDWRSAILTERIESELTEILGWSNDSPSAEAAIAAQVSYLLPSLRSRKLTLTQLRQYYCNENYGPHRGCSNLATSYLEEVLWDSDGALKLFLADKLSADLLSVLGWTLNNDTEREWDKHRRYYVPRLLAGEFGWPFLTSYYFAARFGPAASAFQVIRPSAMTSSQLRPVINTSPSAGANCSPGFIDTVDWMTADAVDEANNPLRGSAYLETAIPSTRILSRLETVQLPVSGSWVNTFANLKFFPDVTGAYLPDVAQKRGFDIYHYNSEKVFSWITEYVRAGKINAFGFTAPASDMENVPIGPRCVAPGLPAHSEPNFIANTLHRAWIGNDPVSGQRKCQPESTNPLLSSAGSWSQGMGFYQMWGPFDYVLPQPELNNDVRTVAIIHAYGCSNDFKDCEYYEEAYYRVRYGLIAWRSFQAQRLANGSFARDAGGNMVYAQDAFPLLLSKCTRTATPPPPTTSIFQCAWPE